MRIANSPGYKNARRVRAAARLKARLAEADVENETTKRAQKELAVLESRIISPQTAVNSRNKKYRGAR